MIAYHVSWPGSDPFYTYNTTESTYRWNYYNVTGVPSFRVDGATVAGSYNPYWGNRLLGNADIAADVSIALAGNFNWFDRTGNLSVDVTADTGVNGPVVAHVVLVENDLIYNGANGYSEHENVMRDMIPSHSGTAINLVSEQTTSFDVEFVAPEPINPMNCRLVVFVQNQSTHEVLNATDAAILDLGPINAPYLSFEMTDVEVINDDGDAKLNPGESANLSLWISNDCEWADADEAYGILRSESPWVTVTDSVGDYGLIIACDVVANFVDPFAIEVDSHAPAVTQLPFTLTIHANESSDVPVVYELPLSIPMDMFQLHFPLEFSQPVTGGNAVVDLLGNGNPVIVFGSSDSLVHAINRLGMEITGFPVLVGNQVQGSPAIGDLDADGDLEIVVGSRDRNVYVIQHDGSVAAVYEAAHYVLSTPALADLDGDQDLEIVVPGFGSDLSVIHHDGSTFGTFPQNLTSEPMSRGASLADLDGDAVPEIIVGTWGGILHAFKADGTELNGFPVDLDQRIAADPVVADLENDGDLEILLGSDTDQLFAIDHTGNILWTQDTATANIRTAPAVGQLDADPELEIVYTSSNGWIYGLDHTGSVLPGWVHDMGASCYSSPVMADVDGDGIQDVFAGSGAAQIHGFGGDGTPLPNFPVNVGTTVQGTPTLADLDGDGNLEVICGTNGGLVAIDLKTIPAEGDSWFTERGDYRRTGLFAANPVNVNPLGTVPEQFALQVPYPNPFNPSTLLRYTLNADGPVRLDIFDVRGRRIATLVDGYQDAGNHQVTWSPGSLKQTGSAGIHFARLSNGSATRVQKLILLK